MPWMLAGCAGSSSPRAETQPSVAARTQPDGYPNLNLPVQAAAPQITEEERAALTEELSGKRLVAEDGGAAAAADAERLRLLARQQSEETLKRIEAGE